MKYVVSLLETSVIEFILLFRQSASLSTYLSIRHVNMIHPLPNGGVRDIRSWTPPHCGLRYWSVNCSHSPLIILHIYIYIYIYCKIYARKTSATRFLFLVIRQQLQQKHTLFIQHTHFLYLYLYLYNLHMTSPSSWEFNYSHINSLHYSLCETTIRILIHYNILKSQGDVITSLKINLIASSFYLF